MLQRVGLGQTRFNVPGLNADHRGVVTGRQMVLRFSALERLVSFLRLWSGEQSLDDFQSGLRLCQVRTLAGAREVLVVVPVPSLALIDSAARAARIAGGECFTGAGKHFVRYRDSRAPLGYDADTLDSADAPTDFLLYGQEHTQAYIITGDLPLDKLLLRLGLQRQHGDQGDRREVLFLTVRRGLGPLVIAYLHRAERQNPTLRVSAALCEPPAEGTFQRGNAFWILRLENLSPRLLGVLSRTPGLALLAPVSDNVAIAVGYRHPVHLGSCKSVFPADRFFLFAPAPTGVTVLQPAPIFSPVADLVRLQLRELGQGIARPSGEAPAEDWSRLAIARPKSGVEIRMPLRLEAAPAAPGRAVATLVPWQRARWVRSICYALPPSAVRGYRVAMLERGILVLAPDALDAFPFGQLFAAPAPGLLLPLGQELRPAISPEELSAFLNARGEGLVVFPHRDEAPFRIRADEIIPLARHVLSFDIDYHLRAEHTVALDRSSEEPTEIQIENQPLGPMPLWRVGR
jgi:hypothetical protein